MNTRYQSGTRVSEYLLEAPIAAGTFGEVWRARHHLWKEEEVAIKLPTAPEYVRYLQREGTIVHGLRHPNIVRVLGLDPYGEIPYMVMELVHGQSLDKVLAAHRNGLPHDATLAILRGVLRALGAAHAANVLHRDLKPGNVLLATESRPIALVKTEDVKLTDFGLGTGGVDAMRSLAASIAAPASDGLVGTLAYMAPETRDGSKPHDARSDLYPVGVMLFEMLTGERPAGAELPSTIRGDVPQALERVFTRLYARYERRYASADEALHELEKEWETASAFTTSARPGLPPLPGKSGTSLRKQPTLPRTCRACRHVNEPDAQFCVMCRQQLVEIVRRCQKCSAWPGPEDRFCIRCGTELPQAGA